MAIFATVVDHSTFRAAAQHLGIAPSRASQAVSALEKDLGVTLLYRTTRQLSLSREGHLLYARVQEMLESAEEGLDQISQLSTRASGELRVTAPEFVNQSSMMDVFSEFSNQNPNITIRFNFSDSPCDLIKEGYDLAIRADILKPGGIMTSTLGQTNRLLVASPDYVASQQQACTPKDIEKWDWLAFSLYHHKPQFISAQGDLITISYKPRIEVDSICALYELAVRGMGITALPEQLAQRGITNNTLVQIIPE